MLPKVFDGAFLIFLFSIQVGECKSISCRIGEIISLDGENDQKITSSTIIPDEFFEDMESSWKGRVKRIHLEEEFAEVDEAAKALAIAVSLREFFELLCASLYIFDSGHCFMEMS